MSEGNEEFLTKVYDLNNEFYDKHCGVYTFVYGATKIPQI